MAVYQEYKSGGIEGIEDVPSHWSVRKLKYSASVQPSNVDKKTNEEEEKVRLCNYVDVYKNAFITADMDFMHATASIAQTDSFKLTKDDVLVTKDSETWDDIAVPAYVSDNLQNVLCGYHLALVRPTKKEVVNRYMYRCFCSERLNYQFRVAAKGITRYGLTKFSLDNAFFPVPPTDEQKSIASFLDRKTSQIDTLIGKKQKQIALLKEYRAAIINQAVTKGLNPNAKMKASGIEWLGEIPEHWKITPIRYVANVVRGGSPRPAGSPEFFHGNYLPWITVAELTKDEGKFITGTEQCLTEEGTKRSRIIQKNTLLLSNSGATLGVPKVTKITGCINDGSVAFIDITQDISLDYLYWFLKSMTTIYREYVKQGAGQPNLNTDIVKDTFLPKPPRSEQEDIIKYIESVEASIDKLFQSIKRQINFLQEYRSALISETVTGKIDVRDKVSA